MKYCTYAGVYFGKANCRDIKYRNGLRLEHTDTTEPLCIVT